MVQQRPFGKKQLKALYATYGEHDLYNSGHFDPNTRNLTMGALHRGHHCSFCKKARTKSCFENLHHGFCAEFVTRNGKRERCGECFALGSDGCGTHHRVYGFNNALCRAYNGEDVPLDEFDDQHEKNSGAKEAADGHDKAAEMATVDETAEAHIAEHGYLPPTFHEDYFKHRAREICYAQTEQSLVPQGGLTESQGQTNGKPGGGKRNKRGSVITADSNHRDSGKQVSGTLDSAVKPKGKTPRAGKSSFAPKDAKPKKSMEVPRRSEDEEQVPKEPKKEHSKTFAGKVLGKMRGIPE